jgi:hypothetical protein
MRTLRSVSGWKSADGIEPAVQLQESASDTVDTKQNAQAWHALDVEKVLGVLLNPKVPWFVSASSSTTC